MGLVAKLERLGLIGYTKAMEYQYRVCREVQNGATNRVLLCQHNPVYTLGKRQKYFAIDAPPNAQVIHTGRGGLATFHGPGQLVCYPILDLRQLRKESRFGSVKWYVWALEEAVINTCDKFNVSAQRCEHVGVWVGLNKLCSIGIHIQRGVTTHGLALNCTTDLDWFKAIEPCGIVGRKMTSLSHVCGRMVLVEEVVRVFIHELGGALGIELCC